MDLQQAAAWDFLGVTAVLVMTANQGPVLRLPTSGESVVVHRAKVAELRRGIVMARGRSRQGGSAAVAVMGTSIRRWDSRAGSLSRPQGRYLWSIHRRRHQLPLRTDLPFPAIQTR